MAQRSGALAIWIGALVFGGATLLHPPTLSPGDTDEVLRSGTEAIWVADHWVLATAITLIGVGLALFHSRIPRTAPALATAAGLLGAVALSLWLVLLTFEATGWTAVAKALAGSLPAEGEVTTALGGRAALHTVAQALWLTSLATGYVAGILFSGAVLFWSLERWAAKETGPRWFAWLGLMGGATGTVAQGAAWAVPSAALMLLIPVALLLGGWMGAAGWLLWHQPADTNEEHIL